MKPIFEYIKAKSAAFADEPLFVYLRDDAVDPRQRLQFVPCAVHFVMTFADLYHFFLTEKPPLNRYQELVNTHLAEEGTHWKWYLADLTNLDLDPTLSFTDAVRFIWHERTTRMRLLAYEICKLSAGMTPIEKLVLVHSIEATGRVALESVVPAGSTAAKRMGRNLVYFGDHHLETEHQHTIEEDSVHRSLEEIVVDPATESRLRSIVDQVFHHFREMADAAYSFVKDGGGVVEAVREARMAG